jgi:hypothetical protein
VRTFRRTRSLERRREAAAGISGLGIFKGQALPVSRVRESLNGCAQTHRREVHLVGVSLADPRPTGFLQMARRLWIETQCTERSGRRGLGLL